MITKSRLRTAILTKHTFGVFLFMTVFFISSCDSEEQNDANKEKAFYDLAGFVSQQVTELNRLKPSVVKMTSMGEEKNEVATSDIDWKKELELFSQADINKPAFRQSYSISRADSATYIYVSKEGDKLPIRRLQIVVDSANVPVSVEAFIKSENKLYTSEKNIAMQCSRNEEEIKIKSYRVEGFQKLVMMDKKPFLVEASISY